jgi:hypothetical protein
LNALIVLLVAIVFASEQTIPDRCPTVSGAGDRYSLSQVLGTNADESD